MSSRLCISLAASPSRRYSGATVSAVTWPCQFSEEPSALPMTTTQQHTHQFIHSDSISFLITSSHHEETRELLGERDNAKQINNVRCMQARKTTHGLDGQHQYVDRTPRRRVNQNDRGHRQIEKVRQWCGQPSDQGRLNNRTCKWSASLKILYRHHYFTLYFAVQ